MSGDVQVTFDKTIEINGREVLFRLTYQTEASPGEVEDIVAKHAHRLIGEKYDSKGVGHVNGGMIDLRKVRTERQARGAHYNQAMSSADAAYAAEVKALGRNAAVTQTGGMCLAIQVQISDDSEGYILITDFEDSLPWKRSEQDGWWAIYYANAESEGDQVLFNEKFPEGEDSTSIGPTTKRMIAAVREFVEKRCQNCGVAYQRDKRSQRYCTPACAAEADKKQGLAAMKRYNQRKREAK